MNPIPFNVGAPGINVTATTGALTAVALPTSAGSNVLIYNEGSANVWVAIGASGVAATLPTTGAGAKTCLPVPAGSIQVFTRDPANDLFISTITRASTANITVCVGDGV